jgi:N4-gp56 family major capsid protein
MSNHSWTYDAPTGVFKSHTMSEELRHAAIAETKFMQFVKPEPGYGKKKGESITITRVSNMTVPTSGRISESQRIPEDNITLSTVAITVSEWGRSVPYTSLSQDLSKFDIKNAIQKCLMDQMKLVLDSAAAAAFKTCKVKYAPTGVSSGTFDTDGTMSTTATSNFNVYHAEVLRDYMFKDLNVPPYEGDDYIGLISTKGKRGVISDPAWEPWHKYTDPSAKFNSEIGRIENIRFIEINNNSALSNAKGTGSVLGEVLVFGADAVVMAVAEDPELRVKTPEDYGRSMGVAWYGILEFGLVWDTANAGEARVIHVTSA